jgi:hypothetical protein
VGVVAVVLLLAVVLGRGDRDNTRARPIWQFLLPTALLVLVGVYLGGLVLGLFHQLPFLAENSFGRSRFLIFFALALAAGYGLTAMLENDRSRAPGLLRIQVALVLVLVAIGVYEGITVAAEESQLRFVAAQLVVPLAAGGVAVLILLLVPRPTWVKGLAVTGLLAAELLWGAWGFTPGSPPEAFYTEHRSFETIAPDVGPSGLYRFTALGLFDVVPPNEAALLDLSDARYFYPVVGEYEDLWRLVDPGLVKRPGDPWIPLLYTDEFDPTSPVLDRMAVKYLAVPLSKPLQDVTSTTYEIGSDPAAPIELPTIPEGVRGVSLEVDVEPGCRDGWLVLEGGSTTSQRLVREIDETVVFPLPDIASGGVFTITATDCEIRGRSAEAVAYVPASDRLSVVDVDGWVLYERPNARQRVELVSETQPLDLSDLGVLKDPGLDDVTFITGDGPLGGVDRGTAALVQDDPDRVVVEVDTESDTLLVLRDAYSNGWRATVDGSPVEIVRVDHAFRGVELGPGEHRVVFDYRPTSLRLGLLLTLGGVVLVALLILIIGRKRTQGKGEETGEG